VLPHSRVVDMTACAAELEQLLTDLGRRRTRISSLASTHVQDEALLQELAELGERLQVADEELRVHQEEPEAARLRLREESADRELLATTMPLVRTDARGHVHTLNLAAARLTQGSTARGPLRPLADWFLVEDHPAVRDLATRAVRHASPASAPGMRRGVAADGDAGAGADLVRHVARRLRRRGRTASSPARGRARRSGQPDPGCHPFIGVGRCKVPCGGVAVLRRLVLLPLHGQPHGRDPVQGGAGAVGVGGPQVRLPAPCGLARGFLGLGDAGGRDRAAGHQVLAGLPQLGPPVARLARASVRPSAGFTGVGRLLRQVRGSHGRQGRPHVTRRGQTPARRPGRLRMKTR